MEREIFVELKYCERCGGLWLRERGSGQVYCQQCQLILDEWPEPEETKVVRLPVGRRSLLDDGIEFTLDDVDGMAWIVPPGGEA